MVLLILFIIINCGSVVVVVVCVCARARIHVCSRQNFSVRPCCPGTHSVDQAGLKLRALPASASRVQRLMVCTTAQHLLLF